MFVNGVRTEPFALWYGGPKEPQDRKMARTRRPCLGLCCVSVAGELEVAWLGVCFCLRVTAGVRIKRGFV